MTDLNLLLSALIPAVIVSGGYGVSPKGSCVETLKKLGAMGLLRDGLSGTLLLVLSGLWLHL